MSTRFRQRFLIILILALIFLANIMIFTRQRNLNAIEDDDGNIILAIQQGVNFYESAFQMGKKLPIDSLFLLKLMAKNNIIYENISDTYFAKLNYDDPFCRVFSKSSTITDKFSDLHLFRQDASQKHQVHNLYEVNKKYKASIVDPSDDVLIKALYCDTLGYDEIDFDVLIRMAEYNGGYKDTHTLIALEFLRVNECYSSDKIYSEISKVSQAILNSFSNSDYTDIHDLFFEKVASLYWAGLGNHVKRKWILQIIEYQNKDDYGWMDTRRPRQKFSSTHTTGLALISLIYYSQGATQQSFYPIAGL
eukprot:443892_1